MAADNRIYKDLDKDERRLMVLALTEYSGLAKRGAELLPPVVGLSNTSDCLRTTCGYATLSSSGGR